MGKKVLLKTHSFWSTSNTSLWKFESKIIQSQLLIEDLRYVIECTLMRIE